MSSLENGLKKQKLRLTSARQTIFQILSDSPVSLSAREVFEKIQKSKSLKSDQASVYRNLTLFTDLGLTHRFQDGRYTICKHEEDLSHQHMHILAKCKKCGKSYEIESHTKELCKLAGKLQKHLSAFGDFSGITMDGTCNKCLN